MKQLLAELKKFDRQIVLCFDQERKRWVVLRMPESFGVPKGDYTYNGVRRSKNDGALIEVFVCQDDSGAPMSPSWWIIDYLRKRDARRISLREYVREMDDRNDKILQNTKDAASDRLRYRVNEDWWRIKNELDDDHVKRTHQIQVNPS